MNRRTCPPNRCTHTDTQTCMYTCRHHAHPTTPTGNLCPASLQNLWSQPSGPQPSDPHHGASKPCALSLQTTHTCHPSTPAYNRATHVEPLHCACLPSGHINTQQSRGHGNIAQAKPMQGGAPNPHTTRKHLHVGSPNIFLYDSQTEGNCRAHPLLWRWALLMPHTGGWVGFRFVSPNTTDTDHCSHIDPGSTYIGLKGRIQTDRFVTSGFRPS